MCVSASAHVILYIVNQVRYSLSSSHRLCIFKCDVLRKPVMSFPEHHLRLVSYLFIYRNTSPSFLTAVHFLRICN